MQKHSDWLVIAADDLAVAKILAHTHHTRASGFHAQQCAEKTLKGFLAFKKHPIQKTHDLVVLVKFCMKFDIYFEELLIVAAELTPLISEGRYPDDNFDKPNNDGIVIAIQQAEYIFDFTSKRFRT